MTAVELAQKFEEVGKKPTDFLKWAENVGYRPTYGEVDRHLSGERKISRWAALAYSFFFFNCG